MVSDTVQLKEDLLSMGYDGVVIFENPSFVDAFVGVTTNNQAVYDYEKMIGCLMEEDSMTEDEAIEFIEYNTIRSLPYYDNAPIIFKPIAR